MSKDSDFISDMVETYIFLKYGLPALVLIIVVLLLCVLTKNVFLIATTDEDTSIFYTSLEKTVYKIAVENIDSTQLNVELQEFSHMADVYLDYYVINKNLSVEEYDKLIKTEITKVYNKIKNKKLVNNTLFGVDEEMEKIDIYFCIRLDDIYDTTLGIASLNYSLENGWDESYQEIMSGTIVTQENLSKALESYQKYIDKK